MRLLRLFIEYEARTQLRSARFRGLAIVYVIAASAPAVVAYVISGRSSVTVGSAAFNEVILSIQPLLTALLAAGLSVDALARERDEGSFAILSVAPISSAGYLLRRWIAVIALALPLTLIPPIVAAALGAHAQHRLPLISLFAGGWFFHVLPSLLVTSALFIAFGTITGRAVLAIIFTAFLITAGFDFVNTIFAIVHRRFSAPDSLFTHGSVQGLIWAVRGYWGVSIPSDAAFPLASEARMLLPRAGLTTAMAIVLLGLSSFYLRRTRRDLRPWRIRETSQVRTLLRTVNRIREEYTPDAGIGPFDRAAFGASIVLAALLVGFLMRRHSHFEARAAERYEAETARAMPTSIAVVAQSLRIDAEVGRGGHVRSASTVTVRNGGARSESHLSFALNSGLAVRRIAVSRGRMRVRRVWERLDVDLDPPLAPGESRSLTVDVAGLPGTTDFSLQIPGTFAQRWKRFLEAKKSIDMSDLSESSVDADATEVRMQFQTTDLAPMIRYTPWKVESDRQGERFVPEEIAPPTALEVHLGHPYGVAADSCGALATRAPLSSRCTTALNSYLVFGGPFVDTALSPAMTLAYIPAHASLARTHGPTLVSSITLAGESWRGLTLPPLLVFVERPMAESDRIWLYEGDPWFMTQFIGATGALIFVPEMIFTRLKPIDAGIFAAAITSSSLQNRRRVVPEEAGFFHRFFLSVAIRRLGGKATNAVEAPVGFPPQTDPLIEPTRYYYEGHTRMTKVLSATEYRVGVDHFVDGVNDFVAAGPRAGTARELLEAIGRRGGIDLSRTYQDYFIGRALPKLTLMDVTFQRMGTRWEVRGEVMNEGTGEAFVPIALRTAQGSLWKTLTVDSGQRTSFSFTTEAEPRSLQLDPDKVCYRHASIGTVDTVDYRGGS